MARSMESSPQGLWLPPRAVTLFVAASDSLDKSRAQADYICTGADDEVQINQALNALPASGGRVMLSEGTFTIAADIIIPANNITFRGQGRSTLIDGDALATGHHGIVNSGHTSICIKKLAIQTENGGGKVCHCIFGEDGCNNFEIEYVTIVDSDSDGIHIEGTATLDISIHNCNINAADGYGILIAPDALQHFYRIAIFDNLILNAGASGIKVDTSGGNEYGRITNNVCAFCTLEGILAWDFDYGEIKGNVSILNTERGIRLRSTNYATVADNITSINSLDGILLDDCDSNTVEGNVVSGNTGATTDGIQINGHYNNIIGNHVSNNGRHGINLLTGKVENSVKTNHVHGSVQHGILVVSGNTSINGNHVYNNGRHGIYATAADPLIDGNMVTHCSGSAAGTYHGICLGAGADNAVVSNNSILDNGPATEDGIHLEDGANEAKITGNNIWNCMGSGIALTANNDTCLITDNVIRDCDDYGIEITAASCGNNHVKDNRLYGNVTGHFFDNGTDTATHEKYILAPNPNTNIGAHPAEQLTDELDVVSRFGFQVPGDFQELVTAEVIIVPGGTGNLRRSVVTDWGKLGSGEIYNSTSDAIAAGQVAVNLDWLEAIDVAAALTNLVPINTVGLQFTREASNALDTVNANCYLLGLRLRYV